MANRPLSELETQLKNIWASILDEQNIALSDNFFAIGGHSLLAARIIARINEQLGVSVPLKALFTHPTIGQLATLIETQTLSTSDKQTGMIPVNRNQKLPLSLTQQRLWLIEQIGDRSAGYNVYDGYQLDGALNVDLLQDVLSRIVAKHEVLRSRFPTEDGQPYLSIDSGADLSLEVESCNEEQLVDILEQDAMDRLT